MNENYILARVVDGSLTGSSRDVWIHKDHIIWGQQHDGFCAVTLTTGESFKLREPLEDLWRQMDSEVESLQEMLDRRLGELICR